MKEKQIATNTDLGQTNQSDIRNNALANPLDTLTKFKSVQDAVVTTEWAWANDFVEQVEDELLGGDLETPLSAPQMCVLLEWTFRTGHRLGVNVADKDQIDISENKKKFAEAFARFLEVFKQYD